MGFGEINCVVSLGDDDFDLVSVHCLEHFHQQIAAAVGVLEHRRVVGTQGEIVLVVTTGQLVFFKEFDRFKVVSAKECRATEFYPKSRQFWQSPAEHQTIKETRPSARSAATSKLSAAASRSVSSMSVGQPRDGRKSGIARANEQIDDEGQKIPG